MQTKWCLSRLSCSQPLLLLLLPLPLLLLLLLDDQTSVKCWQFAVKVSSFGPHTVNLITISYWIIIINDKQQNTNSSFSHHRKSIKSKVKSERQRWRWRIKRMKTRSRGLPFYIFPLPLIVINIFSFFFFFFFFPFILTGCKSCVNLKRPGYRWDDDDYDDDQKADSEEV